MIRFSQWKGLAVPVCVALAIQSASSHAQSPASRMQAPRNSVLLKSAEPLRVIEEDTEAAPIYTKHEAGDGPVEIIQERYPNGSVKIKRGVTQDRDGNYILHGIWQMWDERGTLISEGEYRNNVRHGTWNRWYRGDESRLFTSRPYDQFQAPFVSQGAFQDGRLHGKWTIFDSKQRKVSEIEFVDGQRDGKAIFWYANGKPMREGNYRNGVINGEYFEWNVDGKLVMKETFQEGRKLAPKVEYHAANQKKSEGMYLHAKIVVKTHDDWWNAVLAEYTTQGKDEKHGRWTAWFSNGQKMVEGEYEHNLQVGEFTWWFENGQKRLAGSYQKGKQEGTWTWWHQNGQKSTQGQFAEGNPSGPWAWWKNDGKLTQKANYSEGDVAGAPRIQSPDDESLLDAAENLDLQLR